jgi:hypothetical protein
MLDAVARLLPPINKFLDQIWPSVVATLIAAGLISGYNHAFSGHLQQPRMAALHEAAGVEPAAPAVTVVAKPAPSALTDLTVRDPEPALARVAEKEPTTEAGKDQTAVKVAVAAPAPAARPVAVPAPRPEPRVASVPYVVPPPAAPVTVAPMAPPLAAAPTPLPPPVIMATPPMAQPPVASAQQPMQQPMVTVPDRVYQRPPYDPNQRPQYEAQAEDVPPPAPPRGRRDAQALVAVCACARIRRADRGGRQRDPA